MWNVIADCEQWMMNIKANSVLWFLIYKLWTAKLVYRTVRWTLQIKYTVAAVPEQMQDTEPKVQMGWKRGQNEWLGILQKSLKLRVQKQDLLRTASGVYFRTQIRVKSETGYAVVFQTIFECIVFEFGSKWRHPKWQFERGYEGTNGGSINVTRLSSPISWGRRICLYMYVYIYISI